MVLAGRGIHCAPVEHSAIKVWCEQDLAVDGDGIVTVPDPAQASLQLANNETGVLHPLAEAAALCRAHGALLHVDAVQAVMRSHLHGSLNLDELAAQFKLSRFHFAKTYRALTGHAPIQDFIQLKMAQACRLLDQGSLEVRQIAEQLGYDDPYYFSRLFRKVVGMAPSHYRALHQG